MVKTYRKKLTLAKARGAPVSRLAGDSLDKTRERIAHGINSLSTSTPKVSVTQTYDTSDASLALRWSVQDYEYAALTGRATCHAHCLVKAGVLARKALCSDRGQIVESNGGHQSKPALEVAIDPRAFAAVVHGIDNLSTSAPEASATQNFNISDAGLALR